MILFFLKKNFCDGWDNLLTLVVYNIVFAALVFGGYFLIGLAVSMEILAFVLFCVFFAAFMIPIFAVNEAAAKIANFKSVTLKDVFSFFPQVWKHALLFGLIAAAGILLAAVGIPFYFSMKNIFGIFFASVVFWACAITTLSLQWFLPLRAQLKDPFIKALKKSFIVFFDNPGFSVFMLFYSIILTIMSFFLAFLAPGLSGILLAYNNAFRLRMYKYDWLEQHPELSPKQARRQIPWDDLLADDRDTLGPRSLKSFIFPWKD